MSGVVLNAKIETAYEILAKKLKVSKARFDAVKNKYLRDAQKGTITTEDFLNKISLELKIDKDKLRTFWEETYAKAMAINKEVMELVDMLKKKGYVTALITNTLKIHSLLNKKRCVYSKFSPVLLSNEVGIIKPEERIYQKMLELLHLRADECVFIDDREDHLAPAIKIGMKPILFKDSQQLKQELKQLKIIF